MCTVSRVCQSTLDTGDYEHSHYPLRPHAALDSSSSMPSIMQCLLLLCTVAKCNLVVILSGSTGRPIKSPHVACLLRWSSQIHLFRSTYSEANQTSSENERAGRCRDERRGECGGDGGGYERREFCFPTDCVGVGTFTHIGHIR